MITLPSLAFIDSPEQILVIFAILALLFGASKLPQLGSAMGKTIRNFKEEMREDALAHAAAPAAASRSCSGCGSTSVAAGDTFCARCGISL